MHYDIVGMSRSYEFLWITLPIVCCGYLGVVLTLSIIHKHQKYRVAHEVLDLLDADGDGQITMEEFVSAGSRQPNKQNKMQNREQGMQKNRRVYQTDRQKDRNRETDTDREGKVEKGKSREGTIER